MQLTSKYMKISLKLENLSWKWVNKSYISQYQQIFKGKLTQ